VEELCTCRFRDWKNFYGELNDTSPEQVIDANETHLAKNRQSQAYDNGDMVNVRRKGEGNQHPWFLQLLSVVDKMISTGCSEKLRSVRWSVVTKVKWPQRLRELSSSIMCTKRKKQKQHNLEYKLMKELNSFVCMCSYSSLKTFS
jgi:hypothetical protein